MSNSFGDTAYSALGATALACAISLPEMPARVAWCSADPLCLERGPNGVDALNLAACHSCILLPESSCEEMNMLLDRALLVGLPSAPELGFLYVNASGA